MAKRVEVRLRKKLRRYIQRGHPWVFDQGVQIDGKLKPGQLVHVADEKGAFALAFVDPDSPIRLRILDLRLQVEIDGKWIRERARRAGQRRKHDPSLRETDALRLIHGEGDGMPGLVLDSYAGQAIALFDGAAAEALWGAHVEDIRTGLQSAGHTVHGISARRVGRERVWIGKQPPKSSRIREGRAVMDVDLRTGQKTGLFLDQRENRRLVGERSAGLRVLNLFGYTGGFSLAAALGGATRTTTVDIAPQAIEAAKHNFELSGLKADDHEFVAADCFEFLDEAVKAGRRFDLVICDPPSFASSEKALKNGLRAYRRINAQAMRVVQPGGVFCSASCSSHVTDDHLLEVLADASSDVRRELVVCEARGAASDHPIRPGFPEGRYLSFFLCRMD